MAGYGSFNQTGFTDTGVDVLGIDTGVNATAEIRTAVSGNSQGWTNSGSTGVYGSGASYGVYGYANGKQLSPAASDFESFAGVFGESAAYGVYSSGDLGYSGKLIASVAIPEDRVVSLYGMSSPENWSEDFGSSRLVNGVANVQLEPIFGHTVNSEIEYHVFLTPTGECEGLYVAQKTASGFVVRELHAGKSNVTFDYRIVAKRKGLEILRLEDQHATPEAAERTRKQIAVRPSSSPRLSWRRPFLQPAREVPLK